MRPAAAPRWLRAGGLFLGPALVAYPALVWFGLTHGSPRLVALVLLGVALPAAVWRLRSSARDGLRALAAVPLVTVAALVLAAALDARGWVLAVPVAINGLLLLAFGATLRHGCVPMIERFARLQAGDLSPEKQAWCRTWTRIWCGFFALNGGVALALALAAPLAWWALYNGLLAYGLIGALLAGEWVLRRRRFADAAPPNAVLAWEAPSVTSANGRTTQTFRTRLAQDYAYFAGHFPTYPVLAGAVQLHELVLPCLRRARPQLGPLRQLTGVKFPKRICPGDELEVTLGFDEGSSEVDFEITRAGVRCTWGRLSLAPAVGEGAGGFRVCAVVPTFDNPRTVRAAVLAVRAHVPDVILVDDGSGKDGQAECDAIAANGLAILERRHVNGGKGAAVKAGFAAAAARGFTHVFQVDADGQHDLLRMPDFLRVAAERPDALILGYPVYDGSAPRLRILGRRISAFWVALELGRSDQVVDSMIGFRVYPLQAALAARARSDHMDFDVEIAVRMARQGTPVVNLPVGVRYLPEQDGGISHFHLLRDNLRFFGIHSRLCTSGLFGWAGRVLGFSRR